VEIILAVPRVREPHDVLPDRGVPFLNEPHTERHRREALL
jgi:hypothetical protein